MAGFPDDMDLELTAQAAFGADLTASPDDWSWTDLTCEHPSFPSQTISRLLNTPINIKQVAVVGVGNSAGKGTTQGTLHLLNHDGYLTPMLATSPYWPYVDAGTPIRLQLRHQPAITDTFTRAAETNGWGTSDSGDLWAAASSASAFSTTGTQAQISHSAVNTGRTIRNTTRAIRHAEALFDVSMGAVQTGAASIVGPQLRRANGGLDMLWCTVEFGLLGVIVVKVRHYVAGTPTTLATTTVPALSYSAGTMIRCRVQADGPTVRMRAWLAAGVEPSTWHIDVATTRTATGDSVGVQSSVFNTNTNVMPGIFTIDNLSISQIPSDRLEGFITDVRPTFLPQPDGTTWSTVLVDVGGVGSRLEKNQAPSYSPLRRSIQLAATPPYAYWPLEDAEGSVQGASAFPGHPPMAVLGPAVFSFDQGTPEDVYQSRYGTKPLVSVAAGARLTAAIPVSSIAEHAVTVVAQLYVPDVPATTELRIMAWDTPGGTHSRWALIGTDTGYLVRAYNDTLGTTTDVVTNTTGPYPQQMSYTVELFQSGGNISARIFYNDNALFSAGTVAGTLAAPTRLMLNPDQANTTASVTTAGLRFLVGHARVVDDVDVKDSPYYTDTATGVLVQAAQAWYQEAAHSRLGRLCDEEQVPFEVVGDPDTTGYTQLNAQRDGTFTSLVENAAESESGALVYESGFGYAMLPRSCRYNAGVDLTVDLDEYRRSADTDQGDILVPQLESRLANYWTVKRHLGSEGTYAADTAYRQRRGTIPEEVTIDALTDDVLGSHASWRVHRNVDFTGAYYPSTPVDLAANPDLIDDWLDCRIGSRVQRTNQPVLAGLETIDQVIEGYTETLAPRVWQVEISGAPASVWDIGVYDDAVCRYDSASTTLGSGVSDSATSLSFSTVDSGDLWSTTSEPYDALISGERITVTSMGAATGSGPYTQTATVTRAVNGVAKALTAGAEIRIATPGRYGL